MKITKLNIMKNDDILELSSGEVTKEEAIDNRGSIPDGGLYCQRIFGNIESYACACGQFVGRIFKGLTCPTCGVTLTHNSVRDKRWGHIHLVYPYVPIVNIPFIKLLLPSEDKSCRIKDQLTLADLFIEAEGKRPRYFIHKVKSDKGIIHRDGELYTIEYYSEEYNSENTTFLGYGSLGVKKFLSLIDIDAIDLNRYEGNAYKLIKYLKTHLDDLSELMLDNILVIPPTYRNYTEINGILQMNPITPLYASVIRKNRSILELLDLSNGVIKEDNSIIWNLYANLLKDIDAVTNGGVKINNIEVNGLFGLLTGKGGLIRGNLLGNTVDFSSRTIIVSGPELKLENDEIMLPYDMVKDCMRPVIINLLKTIYGRGYDEAIALYSHDSKEVQEIIYNELSGNIYIAQNRQPSLHGYSLLGFRALVNPDKTVKATYLHPLVVSGFNADKLSMSA